MVFARQILAGMLKITRNMPSKDVSVQGFKGSRVQGSILVPGLHIGMRIYEKSVSFVRPNPKFGAKLAIIWGLSIFNENFGCFNAFFVLNPDR